MNVIYGANGFIGSTYSNKYGGHCMGRNEISPPDGTSKIVYFISTVDNYNVFTNPYVDIETNLIHLVRVLEACKGKDIDFTFISSWFVYGDVELPASEESYCNPKGFYSITKRAAEQILESYCKTFGLKYKIVRLSNVIGRNDRKVSKKKNALQFLINEIKQNREISLYNNGNFYRDFIHVDDAVDGINFVSENGFSGEVYNLGSGDSPVLFKDIISYVCFKLNKDIPVSSMNPTEFHSTVQVSSMILDIKKIKKLGFIPKYSIFEAVNKIL